MYCKCGERMVGDGITQVRHCPDAQFDGREPDGRPVYCAYAQLPLICIGDATGMRLAFAIFFVSVLGLAAFAALGFFAGVA